MKFIYALSCFIVALGFVSCEKCADCVCSGDLTFTFEDGISQSKENQLVSTYESSFQNDVNFPDRDEEVCAKRKEFDDTVADFEDQSDVKSQDSLTTTENGNRYYYSYSYDYNCACTEQ